MRIAALCLIALFCFGCAKERAQVAADARAGIAAAEAHADPAGQAILSGVDARLPAVADVNSADWPAPAMTPQAIEANPKAYAESAPPEPPRHWWQSPKLIAGAAGVALAVLGILQRVGPMLPYVGPLFSRFKVAQPAVDFLWNILSHRNEVQADKAMATVRAEAGNLLPLAQAGNAKPELLAALKALAGG